MELSLSIRINRWVGAGRPIIFNGGVLGIGSLPPSNRDITINSGRRDQSIILSTRCRTLAFQGNIHGTGSLSLSGGGGDSYIILGGSNFYSGGTYVSNATLAGTTSTIQGNVSLKNIYAQIEFNQTTDGGYSGNISGGGEASIFSGPGLVTLIGNNTYTSDTQIYTGGIETALAGNGLSASSRMIFEGGGGVIQIVGGGTFAHLQYHRPGRCVLE